VIKTPEDAELALTVVTDELAAGKLAIGEVSALITLIDRKLRLAERMWKFAQARAEAAGGDEQAQQADAQAPLPMWREGPAIGPTRPATSTIVWLVAEFSLDPSLKTQPGGSARSLPIPAELGHRTVR
jgi:hypothetical protein